MTPPEFVATLRAIVSKHVSEVWTQRAFEIARQKLHFDGDSITAGKEPELVELVMTRVRGFVDDDHQTDLMLDVADLFEIYASDSSRAAMAPPTQARTSSPPPRRAPASSSVADKKVLVVDDEVISLRTISAMVHLLGYTPARAESADQAKSMLRDGEYDAVLVDCYMAGTNGFQLMRWLTHDYTGRATAKGIRVIAMSANTDAGTDELAKKAGALELLHKPISRRELAAVLHD